MTGAKYRTVLESFRKPILSRSLFFVGMACGALGAFGAGSHVVPSPSDDLVREETGQPAFLVSTTGKWSTFGNTAWRRANMAKAAAENPGWEWLYGEPNTIAKMRRMGFNAFNAFALPTGYLALMPDYVPSARPDDEFAQLERLSRAYGWYDPARRVDVLGYGEHDAGTWRRCLEELRALRDLPFYIDFHTSRPHCLSRGRAVVSNKLDVARLFGREGGSAFNVSFDISRAEGRKAMADMYVHDARLYKALGVRPWAYKLLNEPTYTASGVSVREKERRTALLARELRTALHTVEPGMPTFVQVHADAWRGNWNSIGLYELNRSMDVISIGTGGYAFENPERAPAGVAFAAADEPGAGLVDSLGAMAFYRAMAHGKPLVASELYFPGVGRDRSRDLEATLWHCAASGVAMCNLWEWGSVRNDPNAASYALSNPKSCPPSTWIPLPRIVREINAFADFFPSGVRREKAAVACLFSNPTRRADPKALSGYCEAVSALELAHVRADCIFEEQLVPGPDCRLADYRVLVVAGVTKRLPTTEASLADFRARGGAVIDLTQEAEMQVLKRGLELRARLARHGIRPVAEVRDVESGDLAPYVRVIRAGNGKGLVGWYLANYSDVARVVTVRAPELAGAAAVSPFGTNAWPLADSAMTVLVPARFHAFAATGSPAELTRRFGTKATVEAPALRMEAARLNAETAAKAPRRAATPLDLRSVANGGFDNQQGWSTGTVWDDRHGRDLRGVRYHAQTVRNVDFDIIRFDYNDNRTTVAMKSRMRPDGLARSEPLSLGGRVFRSLAFLHAATHAVDGDIAYVAEIRFADGTALVQPMRVGREIRDWEGKGYHFYEWENPRPSDPLASVTLVGGEDTSCGNVVALSALPTKFARRYAQRVGLIDGPLLVEKGRAYAVRLPQTLSGAALTNGVVRLLASHPPRKHGGAPHFAYVGLTVAGAFADGTRGATSPRQTTVICGQMTRQYPQSVAAADEWAEIELPLALLCEATCPHGRSGALASVDTLILNVQAASGNLYRDVRIEIPQTFSDRVCF